MFAHIIPKFYLLSWKNDNGAESLNFYDKEKKTYSKNGKNVSKVFGETNYYYLKLFTDKETFEDGSSHSGRHMFMVDTLYRAFPQFFLETDNCLFAPLTLFIDNTEIVTNKTYEFVYNYFSTKIIVIKDYSGKTVSKTQLRQRIDDEWNSAKFREVNENSLSRYENKYRDIRDKIILFLNADDKVSLRKIHNEVASLCALQQSRVPNDKIVRQSIDIILKTINESAVNGGIIDSPKTYNESDYKYQCLVQLLEFFTGLSPLSYKNKLNVKFNNLYEALFDIHSKSSYFYIRAKGSHKFVIGDNPFVPIPYKNNKAFVAFPISPYYCILMAIQVDGAVNDDILEGNNNLIDFINQQELEVSKTGIVSRDTLFRDKERFIDVPGLVKMFRKKGHAI